MQTKTALWLALFWAMQVIAHVCFKYGSGQSGRFWFGFVAGNAVGVLSILVLMQLYRLMNVNIAAGLALGGGFLAAQLTLAAVFSERLTPCRCAGLLFIAGGMLLVSLAAPGEHGRQEILSEYDVEAKHESK